MALELGDSQKAGIKINESQERQTNCLKRTQILRKDSAKKVKRQDLDLIERELQEQDALIEKLRNLLKGCKENCKRINEKVDGFIHEVRKVKLQQEFYKVNYFNVFGHHPLRHRDANANPYPEVIIPIPIFDTFFNSEVIAESLSNSNENYGQNEISQIFLLRNRIPDAYGTVLPIREESTLCRDTLKSLKPIPQSSGGKLLRDKNYRCLSCPSKFQK